MRSIPEFTEGYKGVKKGETCEQTFWDIKGTVTRAGSTITIDWEDGQQDNVKNVDFLTSFEWNPRTNTWQTDSFK